MGEVPMEGDATIKGFASGCEEGCELQQLYFSGSSSSVSDVHGSMTIAGVSADGDDPGDWRLTDETAWRPARPYGTTSGEAPVQLSASAGGLTLEIPEGDSTVVRLTSSDLPGAPPMVATTSTQLESSGGDDVDGASLIGTRTPMRVAGRAGALPLVGNNGGLSDLGAALREYGDLSTDVSITQLLVAPGTPASVMQDVRKAGVDLSSVRTEADVLARAPVRRVHAGLEGVPARRPADPGAGVPGCARAGRRPAALAVLRGRGPARGRRTPSRPRRAILTEYVALLGMAVVGGALAALASLLLVLPSLDIGTVGTFDPAVDYDLRWLVIGGVLGVVLLVVLAIAFWISRRTVQLGTPSTLRQADGR